jgi:ferredoxin-nitrite reductase
MSTAAQPRTSAPHGPAWTPRPAGRPEPAPNKIEQIKQAKDGLDALEDIQRHSLASSRHIPEDDAQRMKWYGLFLRKQTPGHWMMRLRSVAGRMTSTQWRVIADLSDEFGKGFCDLTTRQQVQLRWFTIGDVLPIWRRLLDVGLTSLQTGMDNVRGVCGCPAAGIDPHELVDATPVAAAINDQILGNRQFTNLPRKFNITVTGCRDNCCHPQTQDLGLVPAVAERNGQPVAGFNVLVGGKQGSGGLTPAVPLDLFVTPDEAAEVCLHLITIFRDFGPRQARNRARFAFLIAERGLDWLRHELARRWGRPLPPAGQDQRREGHTDHLGIQPQKQPGLYYVGMLVPVGRITTAQMRAVADLADRYGQGEIRLTTDQNVLVPGIPEEKLVALRCEPIFQELPYDPSPIFRGLVSCTGIDYCHLALIETKGWAIEVARRLEVALGEEARRLAPLSIRWSGCSAGCGLHQAGTIGLQGCRCRTDQGQVVDAAHVFVGGTSGPQAQPARELLHDVPCEELAQTLLPIVKFLPRKG